MNDVSIPPDLIIFVVIAALAGLFTLVRKGIEKLSSGEKGKKIDLGKVVQSQIQKYMRATEEARGTGGIAGLMAGPPAAPAQEPSPPPGRPPVRLPAAAPPRLPPKRRPSRPPREERPPGISKMLRPLGDRTAAASVYQAPGTVHMERHELRRALLYAELFGPPVAERKDFRLF